MDFFIYLKKIMFLDGVDGIKLFSTCCTTHFSRLKVGLTLKAFTAVIA